MCGRFARFSPVSLFKEAFEISAVKFDSVKSYNIAPAQDVLAVAYYGERILTRFFWGITPHIGKETLKPPLLINARLETIEEKPTFRESYIFRRCLIPADGFYEWEKACVKKQPWFFKGGSTRLTFAIITREATGSVSRIHNRTPMILDRKAYGNWLNPDEKDPKRLRKIIQEGAVVAISGHPVSKRVNSISNNDPSCIEPAR